LKEKRLQNKINERRKEEGEMGCKERHNKEGRKEKINEEDILLSLAGRADVLKINVKPA
jgi:hypothetical protein